MHSVNAIYDGKSIKFLEKPDIKATVKMPRRAIITFLDDDDIQITPAQRKHLAKSRKELAKGDYRNFVRLQEL